MRRVSEVTVQKVLGGNRVKKGSRQTLRLPDSGVILML
jgi:hypothetical protein